MSFHIRKFLRKLGFNIHRGWIPLRGQNQEEKIKCIGCGEERVKRVNWDHPFAKEGWEISTKGDGSCKQEKSH